MEFARHHAEASRMTDGVAARDHWEASARKGNPDAIAKLNGPTFPETLNYLWTWAMELHGRSGVGMGGLNPLTYSTIAHWSDLTGQTPDPHEVRALLELDAVLAGHRVETPKPEPKPQPAWPSRKTDG